MEFIYLIIGIIIGGVIAYLILLSQKKGVEASLLLANQKAEQTLIERDKLQQQLQQSREDGEALRGQLTELKVSLSTVETQLEAEQAQNAKEMQLRQEQFQEQLKTVQEQFSNLATKVLEQTSDKLKTQNTESIDALTLPLKLNIQQLHQAIVTSRQESAKSSASLTEQLKAMTVQTDKIDATATRLTNVIRGGNKAQGNWGERRLTELLDSQGLVRGTDYDVQQTITDDKGNTILNDDSGKKMVPDVILHYPNNEDVVVDSKVSIEAYYEYMNTDDATLKKKYADDLVRSIRTQAAGLARKDYSKYIQEPRKAIDFVIMYVPFEGALQLALATEPKIWGEAFDRQVLITSQQNLIAILKMIQIAWRQYAQSENQKRVYGMAEELLKRVGEFIKRFDKVKSDIDSLHKHYDEAYNKAYTGKQSIVQKANELKQLGVKESANQPIPETEPDLLG